MDLTLFQSDVFNNALEKGFHDHDRRHKSHTNPERITVRLMLIVSELAEALEDVRAGRMVRTLNPEGKPVGFPTELADVGIRLLDLCESVGVDLEAEMRTKHAYNLTRPYKHGGKAL